MRVLLFGTGEYYNRYKIWFFEEDVIALIDNSEIKQGTFIDGIEVVSPENAVKLEYDAIFIMSFYVTEMKEQLINLGVSEMKIYHFFDIHDLLYKPSMKMAVKYYGVNRNESGDKGILLLNSDLTLGGPAMALLNLAKILKKNGYKVTYGSQLDGPLRELLLKNSIPVVVDSNLLVETMNESEWINGYSKILCNTINFHVFLSKRDTSIQTIWWLHDALFFYESVNRKALNLISTDNMKVWAVGPISARAIKRFRPDIVVEEQLYGVEDVCETSECNKNNNDIISFVTIGYIEERKGQDILISAIKKLEPEVRRKASFSFVGSNRSILANEIMIDSAHNEEIEFLGLVNRERINEILDKSDMLICPSREDPMPTVCAEAMMHSVPCMVSDATGIAQYVIDGIDGITFESENVSQLSEKIAWVINNKSSLKEMGKNARIVYEKFFDMKAFERNILHKL